MYHVRVTDHEREVLNTLMTEDMLVVEVGLNAREIGLVHENHTLFKEVKEEVMVYVTRQVH